MLLGNGRFIPAGFSVGLMGSWLGHTGVMVVSNAAVELVFLGIKKPVVFIADMDHVHHELKNTKPISPIQRKTALGCMWV
jgi:hypothetical protein